MEKRGNGPRCLLFPLQMTKAQRNHSGFTTDKKMLVSSLQIVKWRDHLLSLPPSTLQTKCVMTKQLTNGPTEQKRVMQKGRQCSHRLLNISLANSKHRIVKRLLNVIGRRFHDHAYSRLDKPTLLFKSNTKENCSRHCFRVPSSHVRVPFLVCFLFLFPSLTSSTKGTTTSPLPRHCHAEYAVRFDSIALG